MSRQAWIMLIIALLLIAGAAGLFFALFEKQESTRSFGYSPEARLNDLLAARRFLKRMGIPAENMATPSPASILPPTSDVIVLATKRLTVDKRTQDILLTWVRNGGHLILTARSETVSDGLMDIFESFNEIESGDDLFLKTLGLEAVKQKVSNEERNEYDATGVSFPGSDDFVWVQFDLNLKLQSDSERFRSLAGDEQGDFVVSSEQGSGQISVITDRRVLHNRRIGKKDHARFLLELVTLTGYPGKVWLITEDDMPGLYAWLWKHAHEAVISMAILMVMVLLTVSRRFGPILDVQPPRRRRLLEHIQASGWFLWRHRHYEQLLTGMQNNLKHEMTIKHPGIQEMGSTAAATRLSAFVDMTAEEIQEALGIIEVNNKEEFTTTVRLYERLRKQL
ncbi:MAG: DUF4350 domain-containing protein [Gammaproteobacteria bacterium]|nr:DUF4350 domain-containing protein [Gammaproteobacteria bacterium]